MPKTRAQKAETVAHLSKVIKAGKAAAFADYQGMSVQAITALRKKLRAENVDYVVAKKSLMQRAAKDAGYDVDLRAMPGMLGVAVAQGDEMAAAKLVGDAGKNAPIKLVGGIFEGKVVDQAFIIQLSKLPSKKELLTQLLYVFNGPVGAFARLLNAYREQKEAGTPAAPAPVELSSTPVAEAAPAPVELSSTPVEPVAEAAPAAEAPAPAAEAPSV